MVVQHPVEPVIEELDRSYVQQGGDDGSLCSPHRHATDIRDGCVGQALLRSTGMAPGCAHDLPGTLPVHLVKFKTAVDDDVLPACSLVARQADPDLVVDHPQQQSW